MFSHWHSMHAQAHSFLHWHWAYTNAIMFGASSSRLSSTMFLWRYIFWTKILICIFFFSFVQTLNLLESVRIPIRTRTDSLSKCERIIWSMSVKANKYHSQVIHHQLIQGYVGCHYSLNSLRVVSCVHLTKLGNDPSGTIDRSMRDKRRCVFLVHFSHVDCA